MDNFDPANPFFLDVDGTATYIGDAVTYDLNNNSNELRRKSGIVSQITFRKENSDIVAMVKLTGRSQNMQATKLKRIDVTTVEGVLKGLVSRSNGIIFDDDINEVAAWISENVNVNQDTDDVQE